MIFQDGGIPGISSLDHSELGIRFPKMIFQDGGIPGI
jgi:hypothetical protein